MKITLSKRQWEFIGRKTGWIKKAQEDGWWWEDVILGTSPSKEHQLVPGSKYYNHHSKVFCEAYIDQLKRMFPVASDDIRFSIKRKEEYYGPGNYVYISYKASEDVDEDENKAAQFAYHVEENLPETWDEIARREISNN